MTFDINNNGILRVQQDHYAGGNVRVATERNGERISAEYITAGDFVMLLNMYRYIKDNDIQNDFINPYGKNKED